MNGVSYRTHDNLFGIVVSNTYCVVFLFCFSSSCATYVDTYKLYHNVVSTTHLHEWDFELTSLVAVGTDCIGSRKSNYHTITTTTDDPAHRFIMAIHVTCIMNVSICHIFSRN
jgi:hypothetical protein